MSWMFAVGCGGGDDDDTTSSTDAGKDSTAPTLDATTGDDATTEDAAADSSTDTGTQDAAKDGTASGSDAGDAGDASDAGEDAGDAGADAGDAGDAGHDAGDAGGLPLFHTVGRWSQSGSTYTASWPGSGLTVSFTGATLILNVTDAPTGNLTGGDYLEAYIDGKATGPIAITAGSTSTIIGQSIPAVAGGTHTAQIYKMTDSNVGAITITLTTTGPGAGTPFTTIAAGSGGGIVPSADPFVHKIEFIGDEETAGYGDVAACDGVANAANYVYTFPTAAQCDETVAYPGLVSRYFNAEHVTTSAFQMGVLSDDSGNAARIASVLWPLTVPDTTSTAAWTPASFVPDAVVVNLGSLTDQPEQTVTGFSSANFEAGLVSFLTTVYNAYGKKPGFILLTGSEYALNNTTAEVSNFQGWVSAAFTTFKANTGAAGVFANLATYSGGCAYYPDGTAHAANATQIEGLLKAAPFSWTAP